MEAQHLHSGMGVYSVGGGWKIYERYRWLSLRDVAFILSSRHLVGLIWVEFSVDHGGCI